MTQLLQKAFDEASRLPSRDQNVLAKWLLKEIASEDRWDAAFAASTDRLAALADEARQEHSRRRTKRLDPDAL